ncbi:MAG: folate-binding protein [Wenzhouxiangella sp.]|nr:MAG: folate-binding protein [Wenzhouxiangella sp.]
MINTFDIPYLSGLRIGGTDARQFCQSQFTFDVKQLSEDHWQPGAWCDTKGRCLVIILARADENHVELVCPRSQLAQLDRLKMYSIGHKVEFGRALHARGCFGEAPQLARVPGSQPRRLELAEQLADEDPASAERWRLADLVAPLPWLQPSTAGRHLPQFLGLEENQGLSYTKGCYPGQEVVARVHYLGKVKRHLLGFMIRVQDGVAHDQALAPATRLVDTSMGEAGEVLDCVQGENGLIGLAVCPIAIEPGVTLLAQADSGHLPLEMALPKSLC